MDDINLFTSKRISQELICDGFYMYIWTQQMNHILVKCLEIILNTFNQHIIYVYMCVKTRANVNSYSILRFYIDCIFTIKYPYLLFLNYRDFYFSDNNDNNSSYIAYFCYSKFNLITI